MILTISCIYVQVKFYDNYNKNLYAEISITSVQTEQKHLATLMTLIHNMLTAYSAMPNNKGYEKAIKNLAKITFDDGNGYIFAYKENGEEVLTSQFVDRGSINYWNLKDHNGHYIIRSLLENSKLDNNNTLYKFDYGETQDNLIKQGYVLYIKKWNLLIGTGYHQVNNKKAHKINEGISKSITDNIELSLLILFSVIVVILLITSWIIQNILTVFNQFRSQLHSVSLGHLDKKSPDYSTNYLSELTSKTNKIVLYTEEVIKQTRAISEGNYSVLIKPRSDNDQLSFALKDMTNKLHDINKENDKQKWLKSGIALLNDQLLGETDLVVMGNTVLNYLAEYLKVQVGVFYVAKQVNDTSYLEMISSYAFSVRKKISNKYFFGEGIIGQVAIEKKGILLTEVSDRYISVNSGLGEAKCKNIFAVPIIFENKIKGVIEVGKLTEFSPKEITFLEDIVETIGISITSVQSRMLLIDQQTKMGDINKQLESQQEKLKQSNEELKAQQEELHIANEELFNKSRDLAEEKNKVKKQNEEIAKSKAIIEKKADDLKIASKYKSEFLANMSHELRTPLNSLLILAELLNENEENNLTSEQLESTKHIIDGGKTLLQLINDILDLSKVEAGMLSIINKKVRILDIINSIVKQFEPLALSKDLLFNIDTSSDLPDFMLTDPNRLEQIIRNLLSNAFKFTTKGSVTLKSSLDGTNLLISVIDTGIGIPKEKQSLIFQAFQQADGDTIRQYGGTGLGLTISTALIKMLGGSIAITSSQGEGSEFTIKLPIGDLAKIESLDLELPNNKPATYPHNATTSVDVAIKNASKNTQESKEKTTPNDNVLLIIEDDTLFAKLLIDTARKKGFKSLLAQSGELGVSLAKKHQPNAIILDIGLPDVSGLSVLERLKNDSKCKDIPVHIVTGRQDLADESIDKDAVGYQVKPISKQEINKMLDRLKELANCGVHKMLMIDSNIASQNTVEDIVTSIDAIKLEKAMDGHTGLSKLEKGNYDCLILDLDLPDISGITLLQSIKANKKISPMEIIVYTSAELTGETLKKVEGLSATIIIKCQAALDRLKDELVLFLHTLATQKGQTAKPARLTSLSTYKILIVDDDKRNSYALTKLLNKHDIDVIIAENGKEALDNLRMDKNIQLVLMDIMMPVMDGYETITLIRKEPQWKNLPIIAVTAKTMKEDQLKCMRVGANDYIPKPIDSNKLISLIHVWLSTVKPQNDE